MMSRKDGDYAVKQRARHGVRGRYPSSSALRDLLWPPAESTTPKSASPRQPVSSLLKTNIIPVTRE